MRMRLWIWPRHQTNPTSTQIHSFARLLVCFRSLTRSLTRIEYGSDNTKQQTFSINKNAITKWVKNTVQQSDIPSVEVKADGIFMYWPDCHRRTFDHLRSTARNDAATFLPMPCNDYAYFRLNRPNRQQTQKTNCKPSDRIRKSTAKNQIQTNER